MNEQDYFEQFRGDRPAEKFHIETIGNGVFFLLVDESGYVWLNGEPFCSRTEAIYEWGFMMPHTEAEAWANVPD